VQWNLRFDTRDDRFDGNNSTAMMFGPSGRFINSDKNFKQQRRLVLGDADSFILNTPFGVGTKTPDSKLDVAGTTTADAFSVGGDEITDFTGNNLSVSNGTLNASGGSGSPAGSSGQIQFNDAGSFGATSTLIYSTSTGHVGIGTSTKPNTKVAISKNKPGFSPLKVFADSGQKALEVAPEGGLAAGKNAFVGGNSNIALGQRADASGGPNSVAIGKDAIAEGNNVYTIGSGASEANPLFSAEPNTLSVGFNSDIPTLFVDSSNGVGTTGNVGIGTTSPASALDVAGTTTADAINIDGNEITSFAGSNLSVDSSGVLNASGGSGSPGGSGGQVQFNSSGSFTGSSNFFWDSINSRLGIGTNDPIADLDVNGNLSLSGTDRYINFGNATSSSGYGIRDNSGNLQFKDSGSSWTDFGASGTSTPTFLKLTTSDSTTDMNTGSFTPVPFNTNAIDEADGLIDHSTSTNTTRVSVDSDGYYRVTFNAGLVTNVTRPAPEFLIRKNGSTVLSDDLARHTYVRNAGNHSESSANFSTIVNLSAGDYIEVGGRFASGNSGEVTLDGNTSLTVERFVQGGSQGPQGPQGPEGAGATDIANDGSTVVTEVDKVNFGSNLSVLDDGGGNVTVSGASASIENVNGQTYTGSFIINSTGNKNITGLPFAPDQIEFKAALPVDAENVGSKAGDDSNDDSGFAGTMFGFARKSDGTQKAVTTGGSGNSINNIRFGSSNGNAIYAAYGDQNANDTGQITGSVASWNNDGVTLKASTPDCRLPQTGSLCSTPPTAQKALMVLSPASLMTAPRSPLVRQISASIPDYR
jgi:hypothetical protein